METPTPRTATISLVVPAAGCGARAALNGNKILAPIHGKPLLWWTLRALTQSLSFPGEEKETCFFRIEELIVAARDEERAVIDAVWRDLTSTIALPLKFRVVAGGATRQHSVANAVRACSGDLVAVHDAARPLVSHEVFVRVATAALNCGAALPALVASDTVKRAVMQNNEHLVAETLDRQSIYLAHTPQIFRRALFVRAIEAAERDGFVATDCSSLVERLADEHGDPQPVALVPGDASNFKVTYAADLERAASLLQP